MTAFTLADLEALIATRAQESASQSYTRQLLESGTTRIAKKFGEEAVEAVIAAVEGDRAALVNETADVFYHSLVMLRAAGIGLDDVLRELQRRTAQSGLQEKASRSTAD